MVQQNGAIALQLPQRRPDADDGAKPAQEHGERRQLARRAVAPVLQDLREVRRDDEGPSVVADARARLEAGLEPRPRLGEALRGEELARQLHLRGEALVIGFRLL